MKILLLGYIFGHGGIQKHTHYLAKGLGERGHDIVVVSPDKIFPEDKLELEPSSYKLKVYRTAVDVLRGFGIKECDVAVTAGVGWRAMIGMLRLPRNCIRVFFEVMSGHRTRPMDPRILVNYGFNSVVAQAEPVRINFCDSFSWRGPSTSIPALPEPLEVVCTVPNWVQKSKKHDNGIRMVYFGRLAAHKNIAYLIARWREFAPEGSTFDIWGIGPQAAELSSLISDQSLGNSITLKGPYPSGYSYVELLQKYDLELLPTIGDEGAPLVLLEAMACGLPFVANGVGGIQGYNNPECRITNGDISEFIPMVNEMMERIRSGKANNLALQNYYKENFSYESLLNRWEFYLSSLVDRPSM